MAKFCIHCGKALKEGEVCTCQGNVQVQSGNVGSDLSEILKGMFTKPVSTLRTFTKDSSFSIALILLGVFCAAISLFLLSFVKNAADATVSSMGGISLYTVGAVNVQIPYLKIFFICLVVGIISVFIYTGLLYLVNSIMFKGDRSFKKVFSMYGVASVINTAALIVSAIFMFIHPALGVVVFLLGSVLNTLYVFKGIEMLGVKDENKHGYIYLITTVFYALVLVLISVMFS